MHNIADNAEISLIAIFIFIIRFKLFSFNSKLLQVQVSLISPQRLEFLLKSMFSLSLPTQSKRFICYETRNGNIKPISYNFSWPYKESKILTKAYSCSQLFQLDFPYVHVFNEKFINCRQLIRKLNFNKCITPNYFIWFTVPSEIFTFYLVFFREYFRSNRPVTVNECALFIFNYICWLQWFTLTTIYIWRNYIMTLIKQAINF